MMGRTNAKYVNYIKYRNELLDGNTKAVAKMSKMCNLHSVQK